MHPFAPEALRGAEGCRCLFTGTPDLKARKSLATLPSQLSSFTNPPPPFPGKEVATLCNHLEYLSPIADIIEAALLDACTLGSRWLASCSWLGSNRHPKLASSPIGQVGPPPGWHQE